MFVQLGSKGKKKFFEEANYVKIFVAQLVWGLEKTKKKKP